MRPERTFSGRLNEGEISSGFANVGQARVAQLVELHVANVVVAGSSPVSRSSPRVRVLRTPGSGFYASPKRVVRNKCFSSNTAAWPSG